MVLALAIGTVAQWLTVLAIVGGAFVFWRGGGGTAIETLQVANRVLERRVLELEQQGKTDARTIAALQGKTDVTLAIQPFMKWAEMHEEHAQERHEAIMEGSAQTLTVMQMIADKLEPESA